MAREKGPQCRICRREGMKLYLKGDRCYSQKCSFDKRSYAPGMHGQSRKKVSEYGLQLREKQKTKKSYGVLEKQFRNYFDRADRQEGVTGENLLRLLERRLDNVVFRVGLGASRREARQLVRHSHFTVNGRKVNIPSYLIKVGDVIEVKNKSKSSTRLKELKDRAAEKTIPEWLEYDAEQMAAKVVALPTREQIDMPIAEHLIVELYSR